MEETVSDNSLCVSVCVCVAAGELTGPYCTRCYDACLFNITNSKLM